MVARLLRSSRKTPGFPVSRTIVSYLAVAAARNLNAPERDPMIRPIVPADTAALVALCGNSGLFKPEELKAVRGMFDDFHATNAGNGHQALTYDEGGTLIGVAYFTPREFTDRVWELLMIAVDAPRHRQGIGSRMLEAVEEVVRAADGRLLVIETSSKSGFERTRQFYRKHGYAEVAHIQDWFSDGDGKVVFIKRLTPVRSQ
jgi:GNAT superfamily N-acetyltransferase